MQSSTSAVLVTYATRYGSTREVAECVAEVLRRQNVVVETHPVNAVAKVEGYQAVVLGTAFYMGSMLKDGCRFLERCRRELEHLPVALFALGPVAPGDDLTEARAQMDTALGKIGWLRPVCAEMFPGKFDPSHLRLADRLVAALPASPLHGLAAHDGRDWDAIRAWASSLPEAWATAAEVALATS